MLCDYGVCCSLIHSQAGKPNLTSHLQVYTIFDKSSIIFRGYTQRGMVNLADGRKIFVLLSMRMYESGWSDDGFNGGFDDVSLISSVFLLSCLFLNRWNYRTTSVKLLSVESINM